ncbi:hypothetical protein J4729_07375 [Leisingera sp. HS039]|uniref:hypothetical protein n=1 Tax=Leisingera sp. HS039 TaxID=2818496 RepID=UPI001B3A44B3|nr:hypothetical protein [Leisingera sp. HS039]MBQ4824369.1 hypothetical protein [Leisingera sp. HS039]
MAQINLGSVRMRLRGDYDAAASYAPVDIVRNPADGSLYVPSVAQVPAGTALTNTAFFSPLLLTAGLAQAVHSHTKAQISDFNEADYAPAVHGHAKSDISDFDEADYAAAGHGHSKADISDFSDADYATAAQGAAADAAMPKAGGEFTGTVKSKGVTETVVALSGTAPVIDFSLGTRFTLSTIGSTAVTVANVVAGCGALITITAGGAHALDWSGIANLKHPGSGAVPASPDSGKTNSYVLDSEDGTNLTLTLVQEDIA